MMRYITAFILVLIIVQCKQKDTGYTDEDITDPEAVMAYEENDTLVLRSIPSGLDQWIRFYSQIDTGFRVNRFKASGVSLHMDNLREVMPRGNEGEFRNYFVYSPDSSKYLDLVSYNHFVDSGKLVVGEADQQVVLADAATGKKYELMFLGPSQLAEFADWTSPTSFMIGLTSRADSTPNFDAEIMFFHLKDSTFTNFRLDHALSLDSLVLSKKNFLDHYFTQGKSPIP